ncbi:hypothetical protein AB1N83_010975 [Pleurotus pulmonarius]
MTSKETQPTTTATDASDKPSPKEIEIIGESDDVEDFQAEETKHLQMTQPVHTDTDPGQAGGGDDDMEEEEEPEDDPSPTPKWRIRGPVTQNVSRGRDGTTDPKSQRSLKNNHDPKNKSDPKSKSDPKNKSDTKTKKT